jgi:hypothetical protein
VVIAKPVGNVLPYLIIAESVMNASLYFELVDAVARVDSPAGLGVVAERISATPMHPLERRVLNRALRARTEALALRRQLTVPEFSGASAEAKSLIATG